MWMHELAMTHVWRTVCGRWFCPSKSCGLRGSNSGQAPLIAKLSHILVYFKINTLWSSITNLCLPQIALVSKMLPELAICIKEVTTFLFWKAREWPVIVCINWLFSTQVLQCPSTGMGHPWRKRPFRFQRLAKLSTILHKQRLWDACSSEQFVLSIHTVRSALHT